ncbi:heavy metal-associated isoprenylated plant protein 6 [Cucurbita maxima]|uniref:Heavy metal-associated isoprenylated plant protein 6 n=1 Tax=Cucurbita maxima TaxID=3661 RepID=A0A6J1IT15_CUCMA|nr:heavy metal-associated isoprenylated plant protein 6 [Cucurbita maxima]
MGEKVEGAKNDGEKKAGDAGQKKDDGVVTAVFKIDMHCDGCAKKVKRAVKHLDGVSDVKADSSSNKLTVTGKVDPAVIKAKLEQKTKKKTEIVSPQPKKDGGGDKKPDEKAAKKPDEKAEKKPEEKGEKKAEGKSDKKTDEKTEKKPEEKKPEEKKAEEKKADDKKAKESTAVLKMRLHCEGCIQKIRKALIKSKGVNEITVDAMKDLITVKGTIEGKDLAGYLKDKFKRSVEVVPPKKDEPAAAAAAAGGDKKEKEAGGGGGDKKENDGKAASSGGDGGGTKMEVSKLEYSGLSYQPSTFYYDAPVHSQYSYAMEAQPSYPPVHSQYSYAMEAQPSNSPIHSFANSSGYYANQNYAHQGYAMPMYDHSHAPQMFSDENPNACSVM